MEGLCTITQLADAPTYVRTIHHLSMYPPSILLIPFSGSGRGSFPALGTEPRSSKRFKTNRNGTTDSDDESHTGGPVNSNKSVLVRSIEQLYDIEAKPFPRKHWNYVEGELDAHRVDIASPLSRSTTLHRQMTVCVCGASARQNTQSDARSYLYTSSCSYRCSLSRPTPCGRCRRNQEGRCRFGVRVSGQPPSVQPAIAASHLISSTNRSLVFGFERQSFDTCCDFGRRCRQVLPAFRFGRSNRVSDRRDPARHDTFSFL